jgi:hypothetical protein
MTTEFNHLVLRIIDFLTPSIILRYSGYWTMDKIKKLGDPKCYTPSEPFRIYLIIHDALQ